MFRSNRSQSSISQDMGAVRVPVKLTHAIDEALVSRELLNPSQLRTYAAEALVNSGAVRTVIPPSVVEQLG